MRTILVADDNRLSRELVRDVFASADCRVIEAGNGQEVIDCIEAASPDLVLLDLEMPVKIRTAGFDAYITKPIDIAKLRERVDELLRSPQKGECP